MTLFLYLAVLLFLIGLLGLILNRRNLILMLLSIELLLFAVHLMFVTYGALLDDRVGQTLALWVLTVAASESAIGLAILVAYYRVRGTIAISYLNLLHG